MIFGPLPGCCATAAPVASELTTRGGDETGAAVAMPIGAARRAFALAFALDRARCASRLRAGRAVGFARSRLGAAFALRIARFASPRAVFARVAERRPRAMLARLALGFDVFDVGLRFGLAIFDAALVFDRLAPFRPLAFAARRLAALAFVFFALPRAAFTERPFRTCLARRTCLVSTPAPARRAVSIPRSLEKEPRLGKPTITIGPGLS
jgi:hypothetical protein